MVAETEERSYGEQLAVLPEGVQVQLLAAVDFLLGLDETEALIVSQGFYEAAKCRVAPEESRMTCLLVGSLVWELRKHDVAVRAVRELSRYRDLLAPTAEGVLNRVP